MSETRRSASGDVKVVAQAALLPFGTGLTVLDGYVLLGVGGVFLSLFAVVIFLTAWRSQKKAFCSPEVSTRAVITLAVCVAVLALILVGMT
ncbi:hypothetical protein [Saccharothrix coeruleofusca]|nr:hypothetical protein [Saccharothrix coeruleofusca]MBP2335770.1 hypothetical protein [Saccharothrix coeruleofusca]